ncbi:type II toxin-antitoxin system HipA family toxin [Acinetobacter bereziniae]|uniref:type II toxin-antitoxin system HipA family toxin n=1 Tax=Acinetobacter bereziniae TaxID=106648 RepID=UPI003AF9C6AE
MQEIKTCYIFLDIGDKPIIVAQCSFDQPIYRFIYGLTYIGNPKAFALDPINMPFIHPNREMQSNAKDGFGVLADATPDKWGRNLTKALHKRPPLNQIEWLIAAQGSAVGCLVASLSKSQIKNTDSNKIHFDDVKRYIKIAKVVEHHEDMATINTISMQMTNTLEKLVHHGSSMGGARPKIIVQHKGIEWIAKLNKESDLFDNARVEYACMKMAKSIGINTSHVELEEVAGSPILMVKRFDRNCSERKKHYISANSLLNITRIREGDLSMSYMNIARVCSQICHDAQKNQAELFTRMVLNVMLSNTDDHLKNHGFLMYDMDKHYYGLSPAFDILPHGHLSSFPKIHALALGNDGREGTLKNILSRANSFGLSEDHARNMIKDVKAVLEEKDTFFRDAGLSQIQIRGLEPYFNLKMI